MNLIFCKASYHRRRAFQIYTKVFQSDQGKFVEKESIYPEGKAHIHRIFENRETLVSLYGDSYAVVPCELHGDVLRFPFIEGSTLEESMISAIRKDNSLDTIKEQLKAWIDIIKGNDSNLTTFIMTPEFQEIFGDAEELVGNTALKICNFDCNCDNIIIYNQIPTIIDYEWIFKFPVPLDLVLYRLILLFYTRASLLTKPFEIEQILDMCGIHSPLDVLDRLCMNFYNTIGIEKDTRVNMGKIGKLNTTSPIVSIIYDQFFYATVYFDTGKGFSEKEKKNFTFLQTENSVNWDFDLPDGCKSLRFDPVEQFHCAVRDLKVFSGDQPLNTIILNGTKIGEYIFFENNDPQILIELSEIQKGKINIEATILPFYDSNYSQIVQEIKLMTEKIDQTQEKFNSTQKKLDDTQKRLNSTQKKLDDTQERLNSTQKKLDDTQERFNSTQENLDCIKEKLNNTMTELSELKLQKETLLNDYQQLKKHAEELEIAYDTISNAFFWKATWPARALLDILKNCIKKKDNNKAKS